jgi:hypothetical protein
MDAKILQPPGGTQESQGSHRTMLRIWGISVADGLNAIMGPGGREETKKKVRNLAQAPIKTSSVDLFWRGKGPEPTTRSTSNLEAQIRGTTVGWAVRGGLFPHDVQEWRKEQKTQPAR